MTHNRGVSFGTSTEWSCPLMFRVTILPPMAVLFEIADCRLQFRDIAGFGY
jgi:hypothetical protein